MPSSSKVTSIDEAVGRIRPRSTLANSGSTSARMPGKVVFLGTFSCGGLRLEIGGGRMRVAEEGRFRKFVRAVEQVTFSGARALASGHETLYVTERAVFRLTAAGVELTEIAPGVDLDREVLEPMDFPPRLAHPPRTMDPRLFRDEPMGLHTRAGPEAP